jgi:hypothetical protein
MPHQTGEVTYNYVDMTGRSGLGIRVLTKAKSTKQGACWFVEHIACGHQEVIPGIRLREIFKHQKSKRRCRDCAPKARL